jgi:hypothetical protein
VKPFAIFDWNILIFTFFLEENIVKILKEYDTLYPGQRNGIPFETIVNYIHTTPYKNLMQVTLMSLGNSVFNYNQISSLTFGGLPFFIKVFVLPLNKLTSST